MDCVASLCDRYKVFGRRKKGLMLGRCSVIAVFWDIWMERNKIIFDNMKGEELNLSWEWFNFGDLKGHQFPQNSKMVQSLLFFRIRMLLWFRSSEFYCYVVCCYFEL